MALDAKILALAQTIGLDVKNLRKADADLNTLIASSITGLRNELRNGAGPALDTFKEVADALLADETAAAALANAVSQRVRFDDSQSLTTAQATQARTNIGAASAAAVGDTEQDLVAAYTAAKA